MNGTTRNRALVVDDGRELLAGLRNLLGLDRWLVDRLAELEELVSRDAGRTEERPK